VLTKFKIIAIIRYQKKGELKMNLTKTYVEIKIEQLYSKIKIKKEN